MSLTTILGLLGGFLAKVIAEWAASYRRDAALETAAEDRQAGKAAVEGEKTRDAMAQAAAGAGDAAGRLRDGTF